MARSSYNQREKSRPPKLRTIRHQHIPQDRRRRQHCCKTPPITAKTLPFMLNPLFPLSPCPWASSSGSAGASRTSCGAPRGTSRRLRWAPSKRCPGCTHFGCGKASDDQNMCSWSIHCTVGIHTHVGISCHKIHDDFPKCRREEERERERASRKRRKFLTARSSPHKYVPSHEKERARFASPCNTQATPRADHPSPIKTYQVRLITREAGFGSCSQSCR